ncbi:hypothetical protein BTA51_26360 [Hahella sp. CCB-MM4]|uniref:methyltransferase family protein n=1 Tax=Hahella sp. (strain CCB-MM4) TaxID=1926491 RepID=UPI000BCF4450|nr:isoprenylcysteine carboxylmethyltransferase family protein [Hahella sp. CCB-MM4]OZG70367.1 hypothetical protein BTA51_26360 [Hahella sp. CCB-MM4]
MKGIILMSYAVLAYAIGLSSLLYMVGFLINAFVPKGIDGGYAEGVWTSLAVNFLLVSGYFVLHSVMARPAFKRRWTQLIPESAERSTYILVSGVTFYLLVYLWRPIDISIWSLSNEYIRAVLVAIYLCGWMVMVFATFNIDHWSFFGLRQAWLSYCKRSAQPTGFSARYLYRFTRHPISLCWFVVMWVSPDMTVGHLLLSLMATLYILIITPIEEKDLVSEIGQPYEQYQKRVRRFLPLPKKASS